MVRQSPQLQGLLKSIGDGQEVLFHPDVGIGGPARGSGKHIHADSTLIVNNKIIVGVGAYASIVSGRASGIAEPQGPLGGTLHI